MTIDIGDPTSESRQGWNPLEWLGSTSSLCRIQEVYKPSASGRSPDASVPQRDRLNARYPAVVAAYHQRLTSREPLALTWYRPTIGAPVTIAVSTSTAGHDYPAALVFPPGTRGRPLTPGSVRKDLNSLPWWVPIAGVVDALVPALHPDRAHNVAEVLPGLEESLLSAWHGPFAWLLLAEPVTREDMNREAASLADLESDARDRSSNPEELTTAERLARRYREVSAGHSTGLWRVRLLAGGTDEPSAVAVTGLLVAGQDFRGTPYALIPHKPVCGLKQALDATVTDGGVTQVPFLADPRLLTTLSQVPATEVPGIRLIERSTFDVTPETTGDTETVLLGQVLDHNNLPAGDLRIGYDTLNRHTFVCGATGSGKSQTVRHILEQLARAPRPIPWLVIEPAKAEYAGMAGRLHDLTPPVLAIRPGDPNAVPVSLNPLEPEPGFPLQTHIDLVRALFLAAFDADEPFPQVLSHALDRAYRDLGWDLALGQSRYPGITPSYPTLAELRDIALDVVENIGYSREITDNVRGFIDVRLGSLTLGTSGRFLNGGHPLDLESLLSSNTILELEDIGSAQDQAFIIGVLLIRINEHLRQRGQHFEADCARSDNWRDGRESLRHITVIEEAHRLLRKVEKSGPAAYAVELFATLLAEVRSYGEGVIVAEQIPSKIAADVVKNSALKVMHRLPAADDRNMVGETMNITDEQSRYVVALLPGHAAVFAGGMDHSILTQVPLGKSREAAKGINRSPAIRVPRNPTCPDSCRSSPCTREQINRTQRLIEDNPRLVLWVELTTIAYLVGITKPRPDREWLHQLQTDFDERLLQCAIAQLAQAAVATRYAGLVPYFQPERFAVYLSNLCAQVLIGESVPNSDVETKWQVGRYRWSDVFVALADAKDMAMPHPNSEEWRMRGLYLPNVPCRQQFDELVKLTDILQDSMETYRGRTVPTYYENAAAKISTNPDTVARLVEAVDFLKLDWNFSALLYPESGTDLPVS